MKGSSDRRYDLPYKLVQVGVAGPFNIQVSATDIVDGLVVHHENTVRVLQCGVSGEDGVVWLHHCRSDVWCEVHGEIEF